MSSEPSFAGLKARLAQLSITYEQYEHPPLTTCFDADHLKLVRSGARLKNLFLRDNYGRVHALLLTTPERRVDLKALSKQLGLSRLGFASNERLEKYLGVKPGCVSALALINDSSQHVRLWIDEALWQQTHWQCHPFDNRYTWVLAKHDLIQFWQTLGITPEVYGIPNQREDALK
ncbi:FIG042921: similarity to aminoacyl-tRNA editing enzymes YbaK, ProX [Pseudoalteromonas luteoviolacea B = ATCC 29581]|nr:FIG042921: similarity to aminoacyl-tRNA editing enzymes YbaK, ProX [Pseudoalteromonas luteoviolacea B = ATCC 29581]